MTEELKQIIKEELIKLPVEAQTAITSVDWQKIAEEIGSKYLIEEEIESFQKEIALNLLGLELPTYITRNLKEQLGVSQENAEKMTSEVIEKIFTPIADKMESLIKNEIQKTGSTWNQNVNFIVSGGDYSAFMRKNVSKNASEVSYREVI
jgi:hypothetical protein